MGKKIGLAVLFFTLSVIFFGYIGIQSIGSPLKDTQLEGQRLNYEILTVSTDHSADEIKNLEIVINNADSERKKLMYSIYSKKEEIPEKSGSSSVSVGMM